jgi:cytochrome c biogenesis protein CcdA
MDTSLLFGVSLTASFLAGLLALFAPCCITFLFPSYLGMVFKDKRRVMYYTLVYAAGLSIILMPIALGFRTAVYFLDSYHVPVYYLGAVFMILMGIMTVKPLFHLPKLAIPKQSKTINTGSIFGLGVMSGLTSSCCAPVLLAAVTLVSLSPSLLQAAVVALVYVMGVVMPLFVMSLLYKQLANKIESVGKREIAKVMKYLGAGIFIITGVLIAVFNYQGKIVMNQMEPYSQSIRMIVFQITRYLQNPILDVSLFLIVLFAFYKLLKYSTKNEE